MEIAVHLAPTPLFEIGNFTVTNGLLTSFLVSFVLIFVAFIGTRRMKQVPSGLQFWLEVFLEGGKSFIETITQNSSLTRKVFPFIMTVFFFLLFSNLFGLLPVVNILEFHHHHFFRVPTTDLNTVLALTLMGFLGMQAAALFSGGPLLFFKKFFNYSSPINFFVGLIEAIGEFARILSLTFRLFGNMFAEEVLAMVILSLAPFIAPIPFAMLGLGISIIQAAVFPILILIFIRLSVIDPHSSH